MTSGLDLVSGGLGQASGLSLTTGGLLIVQDLTTVGAAGAVASPPQRTDIELGFSVEFLDGDAGMVDGDLVADNSLRTAVLLSLFTDARASDEELDRFGAEDPRGWALDSLGEVESDAYGSKLWLLRRESQTAAVLNQAIEYARSALAWLVEDGIASEVLVAGEYPRHGLIGLQIDIVRARETRERFAFVWA
jgi:phage gp46-like protein